MFKFNAVLNLFVGRNAWFWGFIIMVVLFIIDMVIRIVRYYKLNRKIKISMLFFKNCDIVSLILVVLRPNY